MDPALRTRVGCLSHACDSYAFWTDSLSLPPSLLAEMLIDTTTPPTITRTRTCTVTPDSKGSGSQCVFTLVSLDSWLFADTLFARRSGRWCVPERPSQAQQEVSALSLEQSVMPSLHSNLFLFV